MSGIINKLGETKKWTIKIVLSVSSSTFPTSALRAPNAERRSKSFLFSQPSAMMAPTAESIARNAIARGAEASAETEADSVAVAVAETGTNQTKKSSSPTRGIVFYRTDPRFDAY